MVASRDHKAILIVRKGNAEVEVDEAGRGKWWGQLRARISRLNAQYNNFFFAWFNKVCKFYKSKPISRSPGRSLNGIKTRISVALLHWFWCPSCLSHVIGVQCWICGVLFKVCIVNPCAQMSTWISFIYNMMHKGFNTYSSDCWNALNITGWFNITRYSQAVISNTLTQ